MAILFQNIGATGPGCQAAVLGMGLLWMLGAAAGEPAPQEQEALAAHIHSLAGVPSRLTGYAGAERAAEYVEEQLRAYGIGELYRREFRVAVPVDRGARLRLEGGEEAPLLGMWPNLARTPTLPPEGIEAALVYGGRAAPGELEGLALEGSVVVLEYDCGMDWVRVFDLGARAVIFLAPAGPERAHRKEGERKFLSTPADLPRFYAPAASARLLRRRLEKGPVRARLQGRMDWEWARGRSVVGIVPGAEAALARQAVLVGAYYDAVSPVPGRAPGAEQAAGVAAWLEIARRLGRHPPRRTVVLVAVAGHFEALAGMRDFVALLERRAEDPTALGRRLRPLEIAYYLGLDLSSHSRQVALVQAGDPYRVRTIRPPLYAQIARFARQYEEEVLGGEMILGGEFKPRRQRRLLGQLPERVPVGGAVVNLAGYLGLTLVSAGDERAAFDSPVDLPAGVDFANLARQARFARELVAALADDPEAGVQIAERKDSFGTLRGQVLGWGTGSYEPDTPAAGAWVRVRTLHKTMMGVRMDPIALSDSAGHFVFEGLEARTLYLKPVELEVYGVDRESGALNFALDRGPYGVQQYPAEVGMGQRLERELTLVGFSCRAATFFDLFDPRYLFTLDHLRLLEARQDAPPLNYGYCLPPTPAEIGRRGYYDSIGSETEKVAVAFVPPGARAKLIMTTGRFGLGRRLLLLNGSERNPQGRGYALEAHPRLFYTAFRIARDTARLNAARLAELERHGIASRLLRHLHQRTVALLRAARGARRAQQYERFMDLSHRAWGYASRAYGAIQSLRLDVVRGALFFLFLLLPCAWLGERLLFGSADLRRQAAGAVLIFAALFALLRYAHPAFELSIYPGLILVGFLTLALSLVVGALGLSRLNAQLRNSVSRRIALHRADTRRGAMVGRALMLGVAQMRRRPWRTALSCATLVLLSFALLSFTSVRTALRFNRRLIGEGARGEGLLVRRPGWKGLEANTYEYLRLRFGARQTLARVWYLRPALLWGAGGRRARAEAALGLEAGEGAFSGVEETLVAGRFFAPGEERVCLLSQRQAAELGIATAQVGRARVRYLGGEYRVVGLFDSGAFDRLRDLGGAMLTPLDPRVRQPEEERVGRGRRGVEPAFAHLGSAHLLLLPGAVVRRWGEESRLASVAALLEEGREAPARLEEFAEIAGFNIFAALGGRRYLVNTAGVQSFSGQRGVWVPLLIAVLIVFNTMLGSVYERLDEIGTLNAIGLAPVHVAGLFVAEAGVYAVLSGALGYLGAQVMARLGWLYGLFPGLTVNYSSISALLTLALLMAAVLLSTLYPARQAARLCTPGIERTWHLPAPRGAVLEVPMPFALQREEARGLVAFLAEYLEAYNEQSIGAGFYAESLDHRAGKVAARLWLAPFDQGISQDFSIEIHSEEGGRFFGLRLRGERLAGDAAAWWRANRLFIDDLRRQFLAWRALAPAERARYAASAPGENA